MTGSAAFDPSDMTAARRGRRDDAAVSEIRPHLTPDDSAVDFGASTGRFILPIAETVREAVAVGPSPVMRAALDAEPFPLGNHDGALPRRRRRPSVVPGSDADDRPRASPPEHDGVLVAGGVEAIKRRLARWTTTCERAECARHRGRMRLAA
jgi:hypothetical protein